MQLHLQYKTKPPFRLAISCVRGGSYFIPYSLLKNALSTHEGVAFCWTWYDDSFQHHHYSCCNPSIIDDYLGKLGNTPVDVEVYITPLSLFFRLFLPYTCAQMDYNFQVTRRFVHVARFRVLFQSLEHRDPTAELILTIGQYLENNDDEN